MSNPSFSQTSSPQTSSQVDLLLETYDMCDLLQISLDKLSDLEVIEFVNRTYTKVLSDKTHWEHTMPSCHILCEHLSARGLLGALQDLRKRGCGWGVEVISKAIIGGHLECLKYALDQGCPTLIYCDSNRYHAYKFTDIAAHAGHLEILAYLIKEKNKSIDDTTIFHALEGGHLEVALYLYRHGCQVNEDLFTRYEPNTHTYSECHMYDNCSYCQIKTQFIKELVHDGYQFNRRKLCRCVIEFHHLGLLKFLHEEVGYPFHREEFSTAAEYADKNILEYLFLHQCPMEMTCSHNPDCLKFLYEHASQFLDKEQLIKNFIRSNPDPKKLEQIIKLIFA